MNLIRANKIEIIKFPSQYKVIGTRLLLVGEKCQIGLLNGKFKVRTLTNTNKPDGYFTSLKDAVKYSKTL